MGSDRENQMTLADNERASSRRDADSKDESGGNNVSQLSSVFPQLTPTCSFRLSVSPLRDLNY